MWKGEDNEVSLLIINGKGAWNHLNVVAHLKAALGIAEFTHVSLMLPTLVYLFVCFVSFKFLFPKMRKNKDSHFHLKILLNEAYFYLHLFTLFKYHN